MTQYNVLNKFIADVLVTHNPYEFEQQQLFDMALRINPKRSFLFVSKVLGKHLAVAPQLPLLTSHLLAHRFLEVRQQLQHPLALQIAHAIKTGENLTTMLQQSKSTRLTSKRPLAIIGFAETATALGHAFFDALDGDVRFIHTTREQLANKQPTINFEEEHSHASSHRLYGDDQFFSENAELVLVDDEMTTGKTNVNIIRQMHKNYPHIKMYTLVSILDWRNEEHEQYIADLAIELEIEIHAVSLLKGKFHVTEIGELPQEEPTKFLKCYPEKIDYSFEYDMAPDLLACSSLGELGNVTCANFYKGSGRFSLSVAQQQHFEKRLDCIISRLTKLRSGGKCLVLGTGEFMYIPMMIAANMGENVVFHSTTRSPIYAHEQSLIYNKFSFKSAEFPGVTNYLYNVPVGQYEDVFIVYERVLDQEAAAMLKNSLRPFAKNVHIVTLGGVEIVEVFT